MLFHFQFLNHPYNRISDIPAYFLQESITANRFTRNLFPDWFRPVIDGSPALKEKFKDLFKEIRKLKPANTAILQQLHTDLLAAMNIADLCENIALTPPLTNQISEGFHSKLKAVFGAFFKETLKDSKRLQDALGTTFDDHYLKFRDLNLKQGKVCPMCGLHEYPLRTVEPKAQYDHWLPQDLYPLLIINFYNLVPICGICNNIKLNNDLLFQPGRTVSFYPYLAHGGINIQIVSYTPVENLSDKEKSEFPYGKYEVDILPIVRGEQNKLDSWNRVFKIKARYAVYLGDYYSEIKQTLSEYLSEQGISFADGAAKDLLVQVISQFAANRIKDVKRETGAGLKRAYLSFVCNNGNEALLYTLFGIKINAA